MKYFRKITILLITFFIIAQPILGVTLCSNKKPNCCQKVESICCNKMSKNCCNDSIENCGCMHPTEKDSSSELPAERIQRITFSPTYHPLKEYIFVILENHSPGPVRENTLPDLVCPEQTNLPLLN